MSIHDDLSDELVAEKNLNEELEKENARLSEFVRLFDLLRELEDEYVSKWDKLWPLVLEQREALALTPSDCGAAVEKAKESICMKCWPSAHCSCNPNPPRSADY